MELFDPGKLTLPEGYTPDEALFEEFTNLAKERKYSASEAQTLIDLNARQLAAINQKQWAVWEAQNEKWQAEIKADPEFGGDKLQPALQTFAKVVRDPAIFDPEFIEDIKALGNKPSVVRTMLRIGQLLSEGAAIRGGVPGAGSQPLSIAERIYPDAPRTRME